MFRNSVVLALFGLISLPAFANPTAKCTSETKDACRAAVDELIEVASILRGERPFSEGKLEVLWPDGSQGTGEIYNLSWPSFFGGALSLRHDDAETANLGSISLSPPGLSIDDLRTTPQGHLLRYSHEITPREYRSSPGAYALDVAFQDKGVSFRISMRQVKFTAITDLTRRVARGVADTPILSSKEITEFSTNLRQNRDGTFSSQWTSSAYSHCGAKDALLDYTVEVTVANDGSLISIDHAKQETCQGGAAEF